MFIASRRSLVLRWIADREWQRDDRYAVGQASGDELSCLLVGRNMTVQSCCRGIARLTTMLSPFAYFLTGPHRAADANPS